MQSLTKSRARLAWTVASLLAVAALAFAPASAKANYETTFKASGKPDSDGDASATAVFTIDSSAGTISITLTNTYANPKAAGQLISGIKFTLSTTPSNVTGAGDSGQLIDIDTSKGTFTDDSGNPDRWEGSGHITTSGNTIQLLVLGGGQPSEMIIGPPDSTSGTYSNANSSIGNFNDSVEGSATFNLNVLGLTADTTVTAATFIFGTGNKPGDGSLTGTQQPSGSVVPAPPPIILLSSAAICLAGFVAVPRLRRKTSAA